MWLLIFAYILKKNLLNVSFVILLVVRSAVKTPWLSTCTSHLTPFYYFAGDAIMQALQAKLPRPMLCAARFSHCTTLQLGPVRRLRTPHTRTLFSETGVWDTDYRSETRCRVERWWHPRVMAQWQKDALEEVGGLYVESGGEGLHGRPPPPLPFLYYKP